MVENNVEIDYNKRKKGFEMEEYDDNIYQLKWGFDKTINMGRALGVGFCYVKLSVKSEIYLYINLWKYNITIGRFITNN